MKTLNKWCPRDKRVVALLLLFAMLLAGLALCFGSEHFLDASRPRETATTQDARFVGLGACEPCHSEVVNKLRGSDHGKAMQEPNETSVLAPFAGERFERGPLRITFTKEGASYFVELPGDTTKTHKQKVVATFGFDPLQQVLLSAPGGRLQALPIAWDTRSAEKGGQRWFELYPPDKTSSPQSLHWLERDQNWNFMCADCHSTGFKKGYDAQTNQYASSYDAINVVCEACHGLGSTHVAAAKAPRRSGAGLGLANTLKQSAPWRIHDGEDTARPRPDAANQAEVQTCAPCHSRRVQIADQGFSPANFLDRYRPELMRPGLYHADGQIDDEVYVYGSFLQSRMFASGVRCSDCHDPHSLSLRREGNALCTECHRAGTFDDPSHHHHQGLGSACVDCHMPSQTYMQVDPRRDHSLRIPDPALSEQVGAPDACTACHREQTQRWAADVIQDWRNTSSRPFKRRPPHYGVVFAAARRGDPSTVPRLAALGADESVAPFVRASALSSLVEFDDVQHVDQLVAAASHPDSLVQLGVAQGVRRYPPQLRWHVLQPLLRSPYLAVRNEAARSMESADFAGATPADKRAINRALDELIATEHYHADRPEGWLRIAIVENGRGNTEAATRALEASLRLDPEFFPALINLADLRREEGDEQAAIALLERATKAEPQNPAAWHALGLAMVRTKQMARAVEALGRADSIGPDNVQISMVYAMALMKVDAFADARSVLTRALRGQPEDQNLQALLRQVDTALSH